MYNYPKHSWQNAWFNEFNKLNLKDCSLWWTDTSSYQQSGHQTETVPVILRIPINSLATPNSQVAYVSFVPVNASANPKEELEEMLYEVD